MSDALDRKTHFAAYQGIDRAERGDSEDLGGDRQSLEEIHSDERQTGTADATFEFVKQTGLADLSLSEDRDPARSLADRQVIDERNQASKLAIPIPEVGVHDGLGVSEHALTVPIQQPVVKTATWQVCHLADLPLECAGPA
jgi:hypothetical protein